jgi:hypothetical protein
MAMKTLQCRDHGGTFTVEAKRGRPPVRCSDDNVCSAWKPNSRVAMGDTAIKQVKQTPLPEELQRQPVVLQAAVARAYDDAAANRRKAQTQANPNVAMAYAAREMLSPLGWACTAKAWTDDDASYATLTAVRASEMITLVWQDGVLTDQHYGLWEMELPSANDKPASKLGFDPDEMSDRELIQRLSGMPVQWWNRLGQSIEQATIPAKVQIEHAYNGTGDETPGDRVIKFVDMAGSGYRAFRVGALMKVGSR